MDVLHASFSQLMEAMRLEAHGGKSEVLGDIQREVQSCKDAVCSLLTEKADSAFRETQSCKSEVLSCVTEQTQSCKDELLCRVTEQADGVCKEVQSCRSEVL